MPVDHPEKGFEQAIEDHLLHHGYRKGAPDDFHASVGVVWTPVSFMSS